MPPAKFDLIIYGASSFVGALLTHYIASQYGHGNKDFKWAIAGRSEQKLQKVRGTLASTLGIAAGKIEIITADANNPSELEYLCSRTRVIASTVGPYALYGEPLLKACVDAGVDYCDLTGEFHWIKQMQEKYAIRAEETKARIVHSCGFDSIPSDMGVWHMQALAKEKFGNTLNKIEMRVKNAKGGLSGGTFASMLELTKEVMAKPDIMKKELLDPYSICPPDHDFTEKQTELLTAQLDTASKQWAIPFIMAAVNTRIVHRTNALRNKEYGEHFRYDEAMLVGKGVKGAVIAWSIVAGIGIFLAATAFKPTRNLLEKYLLPKPGQGPSPKSQKEGFFDIRFYGYDDSGICLKTKVTGDLDPGYGFTARMLGDAAVSLAKDYHNRGRKRWGKGGFYTPAALFGDVFMERVQKNAGLKFDEV